jgi:hypothetical protein
LAGALGPLLKGGEGTGFSEAKLVRSVTSTRDREVVLIDKWQNYYFNGFLLSILLVIAAVSFQGDFAVLCHADYW